MNLKDMFNNRLQSQARGDDFGYTNRYDEKTKRVINRDGSFNVKRMGEKRLAFHTLLTMSWVRFILFIMAYYAVVNLVFAFLYLVVDFDGIGATADYQVHSRFLIALFFSAQTLTTVGYGSLYPLSEAVSFISVSEALFGLLMFAVFTGLMYGRVSRPIHGVRFSKMGLIAPYKNGLSFQFRVANEMSNNLLELEARATLSIVVNENGNAGRKFLPLELDNNKVNFLPLNWNLVHPIDADSPLYNMTESDFADGDVEIMVIIKGFNDTFGQEIHARSSYTFEEIFWNKKYQLPFHFDHDGATVFELEKLDAYEDIAASAANS